MKKKLLSVLLVVCMVLTLMPMTALADFADTEGHWGKNAIDRWAAEGVLNGKGEDVFDPNGNMTRAEFAQMLCNLMGYTKKAENTFADVPDDAWYADAILKLVEAGVLNGVGNNMAAPNAPITREMAAVMLCRAFDLKASSASMSFSDANQVSGWAAGAVAALTEKGMMNGVGDNKVAPQLNINRASVATLIDNMVADYVTGDKTITGEVNGIIVVAGDAKVTFEDATVTAPVIVAPAAEGAEVELTGTTTAENVVVAAEKAAVTVGKDASAETVTAAAAKAEVKVEGKVDAVEVTGEDAKVAVSGTAESVAVSGEGAKVDVSGSVGTVSTEAANTSVAVSGTVEKVEVAEGADKTEITAASGAKIDSVTTSAEDVKVSGSGEVGSVTADNGSVDVTTKGTEVKNEGADSVTAGSTTVEEGETATSDGTTGSSSGGSGSSDKKPTNAVDIVAAPVVDQNTGDAHINNPGTVTVSSTKVSGKENEYDVVITGTNIKNHTSAKDGDADGHWVGFGMLVEDDTEYTFKVNGNDVTTAIIDRTCTKNGKTYVTRYFRGSSEDDFNNAETPQVVTQEYTPEGGEKVTITYNVTFKVSFWKAAVAVGKATAPAEDSENAIANAISDITVSGGKRDAVKIPVTIGGTIESEKLAEVDGKVGSYYSVKVDSGLKLYTKSGDTVTEVDNPTCIPVGLFDKTAYAAEHPSVDFVVKDAAGRQQDEFTLKFTNNVKLAGATSVTLKFVNSQNEKLADDIVLNWIGDGTDAQEATIPTFPTNEAVKASPEAGATYYTGTAWKSSKASDETNYTGKVSISKPESSETITLTAESVKIAKAAVTVRPSGTVGNKTFNYSSAYSTAGITVSGGTGTGTISKVDQAKVITFITNKDNAADVAAITAEGNDKANYLYVGFAVKAPAGTTKVIANGEEKTVPTADGDGEDVFKDGNNNVYYVSYYPAIKDDGTVCDAKGWDPELLVFVKEEGEGDAKTETVLGVQTFTVSRKEATLAQFTVKFDTGEGGPKVADQKVGYKGKVSTLPSPEKEGYTFEKWVVVSGDKESDFTADTEVTANITVTAKWTPVETQTPPENGGGGGTT